MRSLVLLQPEFLFGIAVALRARRGLALALALALVLALGLALRWPILLRRGLRRSQWVEPTRELVRELLREMIGQLRLNYRKNEVGGTLLRVGVGVGSVSVEDYGASRLDLMVCATHGYGQSSR